METLQVKCSANKAPTGRTGNVNFWRMFSYCPCPLGEVMKFSINKRYNEKTERERERERERKRGRKRGRER